MDMVAAGPLQPARHIGIVHSVCDSRAPLMKRKIAAILAADIAGYSKLVAEDEEETLRRLESYRAVFEDFVTRFSGRIFNTAGDAILAEFSSAVDAVRCAIDLQESLRTRNLAYPASRQMSFRIGITIGDVVERDGDLLGDGVNIASRLSGLAEPGGLCVARTVYEQAANKLSVDFVDIGEREVKNIPTPIHVYALALGREHRRFRALTLTGKRGASFVWAVAVTAASLAALVVAGLVYFTALRTGGPVGEAPAAPAIIEPAALAPRAPEMLVPEIIPFIPDRQRIAIRTAYMSAPDHKAIAISYAQAAFITDQKDEETAKAAALEACGRATDPIAPRQRCVIYALGKTVVYGRGRPPLPPEPWVTRDPAIETPFTVESLPLARDPVRKNLHQVYVNGHGPKALAISPQGMAGWYVRQSSEQEAVRRSLEFCGSRAGVACAIVAVNDAFVVPIPSTMKAVGLFRAAGNPAIAPEARDDVARRLAGATGGWSAVAVGASGRCGLMLRAASERAAIDGALMDCSRLDRACRVVAIGPFAVEPK
jgi:class 3 adenylate cyclase